MPRRRSSPSGKRTAAAASKQSGELAPVDQKKLIDVALDLVETLYVHLPLKRSMYAVNPLQRLRLLRRRSEQTPPLEKREFFNELLSIFCELRDLHTAFVCPEPLRSTFAYLPFDLERCLGPSREEMYIVSRLRDTKQTIGPDFQRGAVVTYWNGTPIDRVVAANADRESGSNRAARLACGISALTMRWLGQSLPPDEDWVDIVYCSHPDTEPKEIRFTWEVAHRDQAAGAAAATAIAFAQGENVWKVGMDARVESERQIRRHLFHEGKARPRVKHFVGDENRAVEWAQEVFPVCCNVRTSSGVFAYVKIATFNVDDDKAFIEEFIHVLSQLSQNGLILDVRGNGGGLISFGERMLQLLTPRAIDPARFSFLNSTLTQRLTAKYDFIREWRSSIAQATETGSEYSQGFPLSPISNYNDIGQKYQGPIVLVTDALCYSTTDIFAAGFQDHKMGVILGVDDTTGAGGANVWEYPLIAGLLRDPQRFPNKLPDRASFHFAVRRVTRVGENSGVLLEDLGVKADKLHRITRRDVLEHDIDLIGHAGKILKTRNVQRLTAELASNTRVQISYQNLNRIDLYLGGRPLQGSLFVKRSKKLKRLSLPIPRKNSRSSGRELRFEGFRGNKQGQDELVAATRLSL